MIVVSIGCPASVGPEVSLAALKRLKTGRQKAAGAVLVGSALAIRKAAELVGVSARRFEDYQGQRLGNQPALRARSGSGALRA